MSPVKTVVEKSGGADEWRKMGQFVEWVQWVRIPRAERGVGEDGVPKSISTNRRENNSGENKVYFYWLLRYACVSSTNSA